MRLLSFVAALLLAPVLSLAQPAPRPSDAHRAPAPVAAADMPKTIELPESTIQRVMQFLIMDRGSIAVSILREINDCAQDQGPTIVHMGGQDLCPAVTAALKARADAVDEALKAAPKAP